MAREKSQQNTVTIKISITEMTQWFIPWFGQDQRLPTPRCGVPMDEGCTQPLSSDPMINLNTTVFLFLITFPVCEESPQVGVSRPYNKYQSESTRVRVGSNTHKSTAIRTHISQDLSSNEAQLVHY